MLEESSYKKYETVPFAINLVILLAFLGLSMTMAQAALIVFRGDILCLNDGCEIVESLTRVPPLFFNLAGAGYFLALLCCFYKGRRGTRSWLNLGRLLLLAGMAAEGVLVSFQQYIAQTFCSYCLMVFGTICLLNLFAGLHQFFRGFCLFAAVVISFSFLEFASGRDYGAAPLASGTFATLDKGDTVDHYLFFSATCPHCEEVIATLDTEFSCTLHFNPVSPVESVGMDGVMASDSYTPEVNKKFLKNLGISEIPSLAVLDGGTVTVMSGKQRILDYFAAHCNPVVEGSSVPVPQVRSNAEQLDHTSANGQSSIGSTPYFGAPLGEDESCGIEIDCPPEKIEGP